jgi:hypothetical protein
MEPIDAMELCYLVTPGVVSVVPITTSEMK